MQSTSSGIRESALLAYSVVREEVPDDRVNLLVAFETASEKLPREFSALAGRVSAFYTTVYNGEAASFGAMAFEACSFVGLAPENTVRRLLFCEQVSFRAGFCVLKVVAEIAPEGGRVGDLRDAFCAFLLGTLKKRGRK